MKEQLIQEVQRQMLPYLNNAQLKQLQGVLEGVLSGVELSHSAGMVESAKVDTVACFCLLYTSPSPRDGLLSRMPSSA